MEESNVMVTNENETITFVSGMLTGFAVSALVIAIVSVALLFKYV